MKEYLQLLLFINKQPHYSPLSRQLIGSLTCDDVVSSRGGGARELRLQVFSDEGENVL